jgi:hypothetical protein
VCFWEDDAVQLRWPDWSGGANKPSLIEAQQNFRRFGACEERLVRHIRNAKDDEPLEPGWRLIDPLCDHFERPGEQEVPWPEDRTVLYWWRYGDLGSWRCTE